MLKQILEWMKSLLYLTEDVAQLKSEVTELRQELQEQSDLLNLVVYELKNNRDTERLEREKLLLQLENEMLKFERRLPPPRDN